MIVQCAHGNTALYPSVEVEIELDGVQLQVKSAVQIGYQPVSVQLGTNVPEMKKLLWNNSCLSKL